MDTLSSKQNVITLAWLLCGICPWLLKSSNGTFLDDPNEISSWDTQGQRSRFWRTTLNTHTYIHSKAECRNTVSQLFWLFFLTLQRLIFRKNGGIRQYWSGKWMLGKAHIPRDTQGLKLEAINLPLLKELFSVIKIESNSLNKEHSSLNTLSIVL